MSNVSLVQSKNQSWRAKDVFLGAECRSLNLSQIEQSHLKNVPIKQGEQNNEIEFRTDNTSIHLFSF